MSRLVLAFAAFAAAFTAIALVAPRVSAGESSRPRLAVLPVERDPSLPRPWSCGTVVAGGRPAPIGNTGYAVYPLSLGGGGVASRYGYCVYPATARAARRR
jgi:hypothetical protein